MSDSGKLKKEADIDFESFLAALSGKSAPKPVRKASVTRPVKAAPAAQEEQEDYEEYPEDQEEYEESPEDDEYDEDQEYDEESGEEYPEDISEELEEEDGEEYEEEMSPVVIPDEAGDEVEEPPMGEPYKTREISIKPHRQRSTADTAVLESSKPSLEILEKNVGERIALSHISVRASFTLEQLLETMIRENASDLHVSTGNVPALRINGEMIQLQLPDLDRLMSEELLLPVLTEDQKKIFIGEGDVNFSFDYMDKARFRVNYFKHYGGIGALFRYIPLDIPRLDRLGLPRVVMNLLRFKKGLILVVGPTGHGKTTTLSSMINEINRTRKKRIITLEQPVEYVFQNENCLISQREIGTNVPDYSGALYSVLREDPDVIMVSELWNPDAIRHVLKISETGHLVLASMQTLDCVRAVERLVDAFPQEEQEQIRIMASETLIGIIAQRLVPRADGRGMALASEILFTTTGLSAIIREGKLNQIKSVIQTGRDLGMQTMGQSLMELVEKGIISTQVARNIAGDEKFYTRS